MNHAVVIRTARGLADHLRARRSDWNILPVIVGFDARRNSRQYAQDTVRVLQAAGLNVRFFEEPVPTPLVAYAARQYGAQAAICITASHNPPEYAGLKVYSDNGVQIVTPEDAEIADAIGRVGPANGVPLAEQSASRSGDTSNSAPVDPLLIDRYISDLVALGPGAPKESPMRIVYTPLHGVGGKFMVQVLARSGYHKVHTVTQQFDPDPDFPTVRFPNPEEPGALDLALELASEVDADLVLANDPDADRLAVCVRSAHGFRRLTGNQLGLLLADFLLAHQSAGLKPLVVTSIVSSPMIASIALAHRALSLRTLTGFKWILSAALAVEREQGARFVFGFEEALGYCVGGPVRDKDGLSAGLVAAHLVTEAQARGRGIDSLLEALYRSHGLWASWLHTLAIEPTPRAVEKAKRGVRHLAQTPPQELAGLRVLAVTDYTRDADQRPWYLAWADLVELELEGAARVLVRLSGTEPKLKVYADFRQSLLPSASLIVQERAAERRARELAQGTANLLLA